jgi:hypothetical protein
MTEPFELSKDTFLSMAEAFGLDMDGSHTEDLYSYVQSVFPALRCVRDLDLTGLEPVGPPMAFPSTRPGTKKTQGKE